MSALAPGSREERAAADAADHAAVGTAAAQAAAADAAARDAASAQATASDAVPPDAAPPDALAEATTALERLALSRERMRDWMEDGGRRSRTRRRAEAAVASGEVPAWTDRLRDVPGLGIVMDTAIAWWAAHPMQPAAHLAGGIVRSRLVPLARQHPLAVVLAGFIAGLALMRWRPWRALAKSALFAGLASQLVTRLLAAVPLDSVLAGFGRSGADDADERRPPPGPPAAGGPPMSSTSPPPGATPGAPVSAATAQAETVTP